MTDLVLCARMRAAGIEPSLYTEAERTRIAAAMRALPPPCPAPAIPAPTVDEAALRRLTAAIEAAVGGLLEAISAAAPLTRATDALCISLPGWREQAAALVEDAVAQLRLTEAALDDAQQDEAEGAMLTVAARLCGGDPSPYADALAAIRSRIAEAEAAIARVTAEIEAISAVFARSIPRLMTALDAEPRSTPTIRASALALRADLPHQERSPYVH